MGDPEDDQRLAFERENQRSWTVAYRIPIAVASGILALVCLKLLDDGMAARWIGSIGLVLLIAWVIVFTMLYRRGH